MMLKKLYRFLFGTLRGRLIMGVAVVHAVIMTLFIGDLTMRQRTMLLDHQKKEAIALSQILATSSAGWIAADDVSGLQELVEGQRRYPEILYAIITDLEGRVLADTDKSRQGFFMRDLPREARQTVLFNTFPLVDVAAPAMIGGRHVGWARAGLAQKAAGRKLAEITRSGFIYALAAILIGSAIAWVMGRRITRRLYVVQETINAVRSGNSLARSPITGTDEAAVMGREFNFMLDALTERDEELRASEGRYRSLIRKVRTGIVLHDGQGRILISNFLSEELLGLSADHIAGKSLIDPEWNFLREDGSVLPVAEYPANQVISLRKPLRGFVMGIIRPGRDDVVWVLVDAEPEYDEDTGKVTLVIVSFTDITERKRATEELSHLAAIVEFSDDAIIGKTLEGTILSWNNAAERLYGYREEEVKGRSISILIPQELNGELQYIIDLIKEGKPVEHYETRRLRKDGGRIEVSITVSPICDSIGKIIGASTITRDISARKQLEEKLRLVNAYNRSLIEASLDPLVTIDLNGRITDVNTATESVTGCSRTELLGTDFSDYFTIPENARSGYRHAFREGMVKDYPLEIRHRNGQTTPVLYNASVYRDEAGDVVGLFAAARDITERRKAEFELQKLNEELEQRIVERVAELSKRSVELSESQQALMNIVEDLNEKSNELEQANARLLELDHLKSMFISSMSHELRTPLNSIIGFSSIILDEWIGPLNVEQKENIAIILNSGRYLLSIINDMIDVSKIEAGNVEAVPEGFDLYDLILEAVSLVKNDLEAKGLELRITASHQQMRTDRRRVLQCLLNLLTNAVKFSAQGSVTVETRIVPGSAERPETGVAEISVTDTGIGIREEDLPRLFKPFVRLVSPMQSVVPGTGLGLYLTRKLAVEILQGDIELTSECGKGSRFTIKIPMRLP